MSEELNPVNYFVTAIGTDSGKTLISAILCEALQADYWKPIQAGLPKDSDRVAELISNSKTKIHPERYLLKTPASPHAAARIDGVGIKLQDFILPKTSNTLIIEGAGGCMVPINEKDFVIDLAESFKSEIILVANLYLGSINHSLLTAFLLQQKKLNIKGIIFNGVSNKESERIILQHTQLKCLLKIDQEPEITKNEVIKYADILKKNWE
ncbi:MAG TPA: dethiobiotin synthase [Cyclobacteriaceae bacterium]